MPTCTLRGTDGWDWAPSRRPHETRQRHSDGTNNKPHKLPDCPKGVRTQSHHDSPGALPGVGCITPALPLRSASGTTLALPARASVVPGGARIIPVLAAKRPAEGAGRCVTQIFQPDLLADQLIYRKHPVLLETSALHIQ
jgi:hypothetical protein